MLRRSITLKTAVRASGYGRGFRISVVIDYQCIRPSRPKAYATTHAGAPRDRGLRLLLGGRSFALAFYAFPELLSARIGGIRRLRGVPTLEALGLTAPIHA